MRAAGAKSDIIKDEYLDYIDELFESYAIDVGRASPLLCSKFGIEASEADDTIRYWTSQFGRRLGR